MADIAPKTGEFLDGKLWFHRKGNIVTVGLTTLAVEEVGSVESLEFPDEGDDFEKGEIFVTVAGPGGKIELPTPASGIVHQINDAAQDDPSRVSDDPLDEGWLVKLEIDDTAELKEYA